MEDLVMILIIMFGTCGVICLVSAAIIKKKVAENDSLPTCEGIARIIDMQQELVAGIVTISRILFEFEDGKRVRLSTEKANDFTAGDKGYLKYRGNELISFQRGVMKIHQKQNSFTEEDI